AVIGSITPFLILAVVVVSIYSLTTMDTTFEEMEPFALKQPTAFPNWFIAALNYASFNIAVGAGMSIVMGGSEKNTKVAKIGVLLGELGVGCLIRCSHLEIVSGVAVAGN